MKKDKDLRIQELLDGEMTGKEHITSENIDARDFKAYELLYDHLQEKPAQGLPLSFKADVLRRIEIEKKKASDSTFYWLLVIISLVGILTITCLSFIFKDTITPSLGILDRFKGFIVIGIVATILFSVVEKKSIDETK